MENLDPKQLAMMKKEFLGTPFGKIAAQEINAMIGRHFTRAQDETLEPWRKASYVDRAAAIQEVVTWFTADVAWLDAGGFKEDEQKET